MKPYLYAQKGRSLFSAFLSGFLAVLALLCFLGGQTLTTVIGIVLGVLTISGVWAFVNGEAWVIRVENGVLSWSYARWPKSSGSVDLSRVRGVVVNDCAHLLSFTLEDGSRQEVKLIGDAGGLRDYLKASFPNIRLEFVEGT